MDKLIEEKDLRAAIDLCTDFGGEVRRSRLLDWLAAQPVFPLWDDERVTVRRCPKCGLLPAIEYAHLERYALSDGGAWRVRLRCRCREARAICTLSPSWDPDELEQARDRAEREAVAEWNYGEGSGET